MSENNEQPNERPKELPKVRKKFPFKAVFLTMLLTLITVAAVFFYIKYLGPAIQYQMYLSYARHLNDSGNYEQAVESYKNAIRSKSDERDAYMELAEIYIERDDHEAAKKVLEDGIDHTDSATLYKYAEDFYFAKTEEVLDHIRVSILTVMYQNDIALTEDAGIQKLCAAMSAPEGMLLRDMDAYDNTFVQNVKGILGVETLHSLNSKVLFNDGHKIRIQINPRTNQAAVWVDGTDCKAGTVDHYYMEDDLTQNTERSVSPEEMQPVSDESDAPPLTADSAEAAESDAEGNVLNIYCRNEEFYDLLKTYYQKYEEVDELHGRIGDVAVSWHIADSYYDYQTQLDDALLKQSSALADDKIDMFLVEPEYITKYMPYSIPVSELGIAEGELTDQYQYTLDIATDDDGVLKGLAWQAFPSVMIYNRTIAKAVLGTDDPDMVQEAVKDWDSFYKTSQTMKSGGYYMTATPYDTYRAYYSNITTPWVENGQIHPDEHVKAWADDTKNAACYRSLAGQWEEKWFEGFYPNAKVFCYFGPSWLIQYCMADDDPASVANNGGWGICLGPESSSWGGQWILGASDTDNPSLLADIMRELTINSDVMETICLQDQAPVNNKSIMEKIALLDIPCLETEILAGQNPLPWYNKCAENIHIPPMTVYDSDCRDIFQSSMEDYINGSCGYEAALQDFKTIAAACFP